MGAATRGRRHRQGCLRLCQKSSAAHQGALWAAIFCVPFSLAAHRCPSPEIDWKQRGEKQKFICNLPPLNPSKDRHEPWISIIHLPALRCRTARHHRPRPVPEVPARFCRLADEKPGLRCQVRQSPAWRTSLPPFQNWRCSSSSGAAAWRGLQSATKVPQSVGGSEIARSRARAGAVVR